MIYMLKCSCDLICIGKTSGTMKGRISEHDKSVISVESTDSPTTHLLTSVFTFKLKIHRSCRDSQPGMKQRSCLKNSKTEVINTG